VTFGEGHGVIEERSTLSHCGSIWRDRTHSEWFFLFTKDKKVGSPTLILQITWYIQYTPQLGLHELAIPVPSLPYMPLMPPMVLCIDGVRQSVNELLQTLYTKP